MLIHIKAAPLPGHGNVHVAVQRKDKPGELLGVYPGDAESAEWALECDAEEAPDGVEVRGPYIQNRLGGRFVYLSWGTLDAEGRFIMFRRAKLMLSDVDPTVLRAAMRSGHLTARLGLRDAEGQPRCGRVRSPDITWSATDEM